jgi:Penicillin-insensitive murein endopeptidase
VWFSDKQGWIHGSKLVADTRELVTVAASTGNVRSGPDTSNRVVGTTSSGTQWLVVGLGGTNGEWKQFYYAGSVRWMHQSLLQNYNQPTSSAGFVQVPPSGEGFYAVTTSDRLWGLPRLVYPIMDTARQLTRDNPSWGKLGINDLSFKAGGTMSPHASHKNGDDADIRLLRNDGLLEATNIYESTYSRDRTKTLITGYFNKFLNIDVVLFGDRNVFGRLTSNRSDECAKAPVSSTLQYVACFPNHANHLHVRVN